MYKILIADRCSESLTDLKNSLTAEGYEILLAEDGLTAFNIAVLENPDLIISDIDIARLDGFELLMTLQINRYTSSTPLFFTGTDDTEQKIKLSKTLGALEYFIKPFKPQDIIDSINKLQDAGQFTNHLKL